MEKVKRRKEEYHQTVSDFRANRATWYDVIDQWHRVGQMQYRLNLRQMRRMEADANRTKKGKRRGSK